MYKLAAASENEPIVFGSARPGYSNKQVTEWIEFIQNQNIKRVCYLLPESQLTRYANLLDTYRQIFGLDRVCWTPIEDFHFAIPEILTHQILPLNKLGKILTKQLSLPHSKDAIRGKLRRNSICYWMNAIDGGASYLDAD
jgi:hypothetical protein